MKYIYLVSFIFLAFYSANAQEPVIKWQENAGGTDYEASFDLAQDNLGNYIMVGYTFSTDKDAIAHHGSSYEDFFVAKIDPNGNLLWTACYGGTNQDIAYSVCTIDTTIYISGTELSIDGDITSHYGGGDVWLLQLSASGVILNQHVYGGTYDDAGYAMMKSSENLYIAGTTISVDSDIVKNPLNGYDALLIKTKQNGEKVWAKAFGGRGTERYFGLMPMGANILCVGSSDTEDTSFVGGYGSADILVSMIDNNGNAQWHRRYGGSNYDIARSVTYLSDTSFLVVGNSYSSDNYVPENRGNYDVWLLALGASGDTIWSKTIGGSREDMVNKVIHTQDDNLLLVGSTISDDGYVHGHHPGNKDMWLVKLTLNGDTLWTKCIGSIVEDAAYGIVENNQEVNPENEEYVVSGYSQDVSGEITKNYGLSDFWMAKLGHNTEGLYKIASNKISIFPNPASKKLHFETHLKGSFKYELYDINGKVCQYKILNTASGVINISKLKAGVYWIKFSQKNTFGVKKLVVSY